MSKPTQTNQTAHGKPELPTKATPESIAADKAALAQYKATHAAALPDEPQEQQIQHSPLPWSVVQNGKQIDIHSKDSLANREWTVAQNLREHDAQFIVEMINSRTPEWYLRNQAVNHAEKLAEALRECLKCHSENAPIHAVITQALAAYEADQ